MTVRNVILDCDWFVLGRQRLIKQLAFVDCESERSLLHVFSFPEELACYDDDFRRQSHHSHGISWDKRGFFDLSNVCQVMQTLRCHFRGDRVVFWAKGEEKAKVLSQHGVQVKNLESVGCTRYGQLTEDPQTTMNKARVFAKWYRRRDVI